MFPLGRQVKAIRILYEIKQQVLADKIGVGRTYLSLFENDQARLTDEQATRLISVLEEMGIAPKVTIELFKELPKELKAKAAAPKKKSDAAMVAAIAA